MYSKQTENRGHDCYIYVHQLPFEVVRRLSLILDLNNDWKVLGEEYLKFDCYELNEISCQKSPTQRLLHLWSNKEYARVSQLFWFLIVMKKYDAMKELRPYVDGRYLSKNRVCPTESKKADSGFCQSNVKPEQTKISAAQDDEKNSSDAVENTSYTDLMELKSGLQFIDYEVLEASTGSWSEARKLGRGGFGDVYVGVVKQTHMAIKHLRPQKGNEEAFNTHVRSQFQDLLKELKYLDSNRHPNILPLYGYSYKEGNFCLVSQFMQNGSLEDRLLCRKRTRPLSALERYDIARGIALGLQFLHDREKPLIDGDIKSANILLDSSLQPKIGDFGLSREAPTSSCSFVEVSKIQGTKPYLPDEYFRSKELTTRVDTYSFGVVLFEIITGLRAQDRKTKIFLKDYIMKLSEEGNLERAIDPNIKFEFEYSRLLANHLFSVGEKCVLYQATLRPKMTDVYRYLNSMYSKLMIDINLQKCARYCIDPTLSSNVYRSAATTASRLGQIPNASNLQPIHNQQTAVPTNSIAAVPARQNIDKGTADKMNVPEANGALEEALQTKGAQCIAGQVHVDHPPLADVNINQKYAGTEITTLKDDTKVNPVEQNGGEIVKAEPTPHHSRETEISGNLPLIPELQH